MKDLPLDEQPREKALKYGFSSLSDAELLAILLRTGTKDLNVKELALEILKEMNNLNGLQNSRISKLASIKGVGQVKAITILAEGNALPPEYRDHALNGNYSGCRECHIALDWLLVYEIVDRELLLYLTRTGTHSDIF